MQYALNCALNDDVTEILMAYDEVASTLLDLVRD